MKDEKIKQAIDAIDVPKEKLQHLVIIPEKKTYPILRYAAAFGIVILFVFGMIPNNSHVKEHYVTKILAYGQTEILEEKPIEIKMNIELLKNEYAFSSGYDPNRKEYVLNFHIPFDMIFEGENIQEIYYSMQSNEYSSMSLFSELNDQYPITNLSDNEHIIHKEYEEYNEKEKRLHLKN